MVKKIRFVLLACVVTVLVALCSCGNESGESRFYSVDVINATPGSITVRYNWDEFFLFYWSDEVTIGPGAHQIIEWSSQQFTEYIEVEYLGIKKLYTVPQLGSVTIYEQDFQ
jgi:hypothetical protein